MKRDRVILKGFGLYFEGEGRPAVTLTYCGTGLLLCIIMVALCVGNPPLSRGLLSLAQLF